MLPDTWLAPSDGECVYEYCPSGFILYHVPRVDFWVITRRLPGLCSHKRVTWCLFRVRYLSVLRRYLQYITVVYRPPTTNASQFLSDFSDLLSTVFLYKRHVSVAESVTSRVHDSSNNSAASYANLCGTYGLLQHVQELTHRNGHWLDLTH